MKRGLLVAIALLLLASMALIGCAQPAPAPTPTPAPAPKPAPAPTPAPAPKPTVTPAPAVMPSFHLRFSTGYPPPPAIDAQSNEWAMNEITKRTEGKITFDKFYGSSLGEVKEHLDIIGAGVADLGETPLGAWPERAPLSAFGANAFPFGPADPVVTAKISLKIMDEFPAYAEGQVADDKVRVLGIWMWDTYDVLSTKPIQTLADFKGLKVGAWGIYYPKWLEAIAAVGITSPATERYILLKQGLIEATFHPIDAQWNNKDWEIAKYYTFLDAGVGPNKDVSINLAVWNKLPPEYQKIFNDVYRNEGMVRHGEELLKLRAADEALLKKAGVTFYTLSSADKEKWAAAIPDLVKWWVDRMGTLGFGTVAPQMAKRWISLSEEFGHKWYPVQKQQWSWLLK